MPVILIIEDEALIAHDIAMTLGDAGYSKSVIALGSKEALEKMQHCAPALIISDHNLEEDITGPEVVAQIYALHGQIPTIYLTATPELCASHHNHAVLSKPLDEGYFIEKVRSALRG